MTPIRRVVLCCFLVSAGSAIAVEPGPGLPRPDAPPLAVPGPNAVGVTTRTLVNPAQIDVLAAAGEGAVPRRDRRLPVELWYPAARCDDGGARYEDALGSGPDDPERPIRAFAFDGRACRDADGLTGDARALVVMSHGYPGSRVLMAWLGEHLASHGLVVAAIDHAESTHADKLGFASTLYHRPGDIRFVIDALGGSSAVALPVSIDQARVALVGYSMGGYGVLTAAGAGVAEWLVRAGQVPHGAMADWQSPEPDPAIRAVVSFAAWGAPAALEAVGFGARSLWEDGALETIEAPVLHIAGDRDAVSGYADGVRWLWEQGRAGRTQLLTYQLAGHNVAPMPPPVASRPYPREFAHYADAVWDIERLNDLNRHFVAGFLLEHLDGEHTPALEPLPPGVALEAR